MVTTAALSLDLNDGRRRGSGVPVTLSSAQVWWLSFGGGCRQGKGFTHSSTVLAAQGKSKERGSADASVLCRLSLPPFAGSYGQPHHPTGFFNTKSMASPWAMSLSSCLQISQNNGKLHALSAGEKELRYDFLLAWKDSRIHGYFLVHIF